MSRARIFILFLFIFTFSCTPRVSLYREPLDREGELLIYLQPLPQGAERLRFSLEGLSAIKQDGSKYPLTLSLREVKWREHQGEQNLLASAVLPPGTYRGVSITMNKAFLMGEEGEGELLVPEEPVTVEREFSLGRREALALFLSFDPSPSISSGFSFLPAFSLETPVSEPVNLTGYATDPEANLIHVFNKKTHRIIATIATGRAPKGIVLDQRRRRAYVALSGADVVEIIDLFANVIVGRISLNPGDEPLKLALTPDGRTLLSANYGSGTVSIIDPASQFEIGRVKVDQGPTDVAIDPLGLRAYVVNSLSDSLSIIDLSQRRLITTLSVGPSPLKASFNRAGDRLYVTSRHSPDLFVIDPKSFNVTGRIFVGAGAVSLIVDKLTDLILVGNELTGEISIVEPRSFIPVDSFSIGGTPFFMTIDAEERSLFVTVPDRQKVVKINFVSRDIIAEIPAIGSTFEVVVMGEIIR
jgi:YVTN family beta-propeller protein